MLNADLSTHQRELLIDGDYHAQDTAGQFGFDTTARELIAVDTATNTLVWA